MSTNGMIRTVLATQIGEAVAKDETPEFGGCDLSAGMFGPNLSRVILDIAEALAPTGERFFCNKCGYHGKQQDHLKPDSLTPCGYIAVPGLSTFVLYAWHIQRIGGNDHYVYNEADLAPWRDNKNVKKITPLYALRK